MRVGAERIQKIMRSLRNFSRADEAEIKQVNVHEGIDSTLMILQNRLKAKSDRPEIAVVKHYSELPDVECHAGQINQVFMNLLANAIDALEESIVKAHNLTPTITIYTEALNSDCIRIRFADGGLGVPEGVRQKLFDPFFTTKPVGKGTGLVLSKRKALY